MPLPLWTASDRIPMIYRTYFYVCYVPDGSNIYYINSKDTVNSIWTPVPLKIC